jgi:GAF domain-containing protein
VSLKPPLPGAKKLVMDPESFQRLLKAAFVVQQHNDQSRQGGPTLTAEPKPSMEQALNAIVEIQNLILTGQLKLADALSLITERTAAITRADGIAIGIVQAERFFYLHGTGSAQTDSGAEYPCEETLSAECLASGKPLQIADTEKDLYLSPELCRRLRVRSLIAAPIHHDGKLAGAIELRYVQPGAFQEPEVRTSQLMAGLITTALARAAEVESKRTLAQERAAMLDAIERIKPQLERMAVVPEASAAMPTAETRTLPEELEIPQFTEEELRALLPESAGGLAGEYDDPLATGQSALATGTCRRCGHVLSREEVFCGLCGTQRWISPPAQATASETSAKTSEPNISQPEIREETTETVLPITGNDGTDAWEKSAQEFQPADPEPPAPLAQFLEDLAAQFPPEEPEEMHSTLKVPAVATNWQEPQKQGHPNQGPPNKESPAPPPVVEDNGSAEEVQAAPALANPASQELVVQMVQSPEVVPALPPAPEELTSSPEPWTTARRTKQWLESLAPSQTPELYTSTLRRLWQTQRANFYLAISAILLIVIVAGWGTQPPDDQVGGRNRSLQPKLTFFESLLVDLGLAVPPPTPTYRGNPEIKVWVDLHTALYYCPDATQYGKTANGKFTTQREAQMDQFEPAFRKACN